MFCFCLIHQKKNNQFCLCDLATLVTLIRYRSASLPRNYENHKNQNCNCNNATLITLSAGSRCRSCRWVHVSLNPKCHNHTNTYTLFTAFNFFSINFSVPSLSQNLFSSFSSIFALLLLLFRKIFQFLI
jgi:hypothetical protein